mmetsp:Transcript_8222/g.9571  ORF Transcript_8222/g.9571 Transcript_8222/m.9571 type:complete len:145 (+) Transcript_8222:115-549(+)|eukprot:CAMPEP_0170790168 /NCGR_PEP_ID=MMETSP0733-20121128/20229_1 /TAXON_ID=186038 /ORGANISM="Fragilariopsis kerguelensis, Strain L26-C5" /LENGTH=144 /DNA_ID=CAMNT_0011137537 /DNA_START=78 /DNA_END=512 /DNA_ORIENTATION=-
MNENQNVYVRDGRTTSRVLNRPGGTCSISIGGYTEEELERQRQIRESRANGGVGNTSSNNVISKNQNIENVKKNASKDKISEQEVEKTVSTTVDTTLLPSKKSTSVSSNAYASSSTTNSYNVLTDRPTSKVTRPPGGQTNWSLG